MRQKKTTISAAAIAPTEFGHGLTRIFTDAERAIRKSVLESLAVASHPLQHPCSSVAKKTYLQHHRLTLGHDQKFFLDPVGAGGCKQPLRRFMEWLEAKPKAAVMHRD